MRNAGSNDTMGHSVQFWMIFEMMISAVKTK